MEGNLEPTTRHHRATKLRGISFTKGPEMIYCRGLAS